MQERSLHPSGWSKLLSQSFKLLKSQHNSEWGKNNFPALYMQVTVFLWVPKYPWPQSTTAQLLLHMLLLKAKTCWNNHSQCLKRMCFRHRLMHLVSSGSMKSQNKTAATSKIQGWCGLLLSLLPSPVWSLTVWKTTKNCLHHKPLFQGKW